MNQRNFVVLVTIAFFGTFMSTTEGQTINEDMKIRANDGMAEDQFGYAVAMDRGVIAVGAPQDDDNGTDSGSAYLIVASTGSQIAKLMPNDGASGDQFGYSIAVRNNIVAVGAPSDEHDGVTSGSVYLFDASTGDQLNKLTPLDGVAGDEFGYSVAIDNGIVAVGAMRDDDLGDSSGAAYLFDASTGAQLDKLLPNEGAANQNFGVSIAMDNGVAVIGARTYFVPGQGFTWARAYLFDVATGGQTNSLRADIENFNGDMGGFFGDAVDIDNGLVVVGAWARSIFFDHSGAAYVFDASTGEQLDFIFPSDGQDRDHFGYSVSIENGVVAIGAEEDDDAGFDGGSAYLFDAVTGSQINKLIASDGEAFDVFGSSIAIGNGRVAVGASGDDDDRGSVYIFVAADIQPGDINLDGQVNLLDVAPFVDLLSSGDFQIEADVNQDGIVNLLDVGPFVDLLSG